MSDLRSPPPDAFASRDLTAEEGAQARRGFALIASGKVWFMGCAALLNLGLPRVFSDPSAFGDYAAVNTAISIINMVVVTAALQSAAKWVSERPEAVGTIRRMTLSLQSLFALMIAVIGYSSSEWVCDVIFRDGTLVVYWRLALLITVFYCLYATCIGVLNGQKRFGQQALFDAGFATLKVSLILGLVATGYGVGGAFVGFGLAAALVTFGSLWVTRTQGSQVSSGATFSWRRLIVFTVQSMGFVLFFNLLLQGDVIILKAALLETVSRDAMSTYTPAWIETLVQARAVDASSPRDLTAALVGLYRAVKNLTLLPYQAVIAIALVVFPLISRSTASDDVEATRAYSQQALRVSWLLVLAMVSVLGAGGHELVTMLFGDVYGPASKALIPMSLAAACLALTYLMGTMLIAADQARDAVVVVALVSLGQMGGLHLLMGQSDAGPSGLHVASYIVCVAGILGLFVAGFVTHRRLGVQPPWLALGRGALGCAVALLSVAWIDLDPIVTIFVRPGIAAVVFVVVCVMTNELTAKDLSLIRSTLSGRTS